MRLRRKKTLIEQAREQAAEYAEVVKPQVEQAVASAKLAAATSLTEARVKAAPVLAEARERAAAGLVEAREKAGPALADARGKAGPALADAREKAGPMIADARAKAAPLVAAGAAAASEKALAAQERAAAKVAELRGEPPRKHRGGKLKKLALFAVVAAVVGFVARKLQGGGASDNWQSSYTPTPAPAPAPASPMPVAEEADDTGGSSPDEAIADATETPHGVTTPDEPAEVIDIDDPRSP